MTVLRVAIAIAADAVPIGALVAVEVIQVTTGDTKHRLAMSGGRDMELELETGSYLIRAIRAGAPWRSKTVIISEEIPRVLDLSSLVSSEDTPGEATSWTEAGLAGGFDDHVESVRPRLGDGVEEAIASARRSRGDRAWGFLCDQAVVLRVPRMLDTPVIIETPAAEGGPYFLCVAGPHVPPRFTSLPPGSSAIVTQRGPSAVAVRVQLSDGPAQSLLEFVSAGQVDAARIIATAVLRQVLRPGADPAAVCAVAHLLFGSIPPKTGTPLADALMRAERFPDARLIEAIALLDCDESEASRRARAALTLAAVSPEALPIFTPGLRALRNALWRIENQDQVAGEWDGDLAAASQQIDRYLMSADQSSPLTSFTGLTPYSPRPVGESELDATTFQDVVDDVNQAFDALGTLGGPDKTLTARHHQATVTWQRYSDGRGGIQIDGPWSKSPLRNLAVALVGDSGETLSVARLSSAGGAVFPALPSSSNKLVVMTQVAFDSVKALRVPPPMAKGRAGTSAKPRRQQVTSERLAFTAEQWRSERGALECRLTVASSHPEVDGCWALVLCRAPAESASRYRTLALPLRWDSTLTRASSSLRLRIEGALQWCAVPDPVGEIPPLGARAILEHSLDCAEGESTRSAINAELERRLGGPLT